MYSKREKILTIIESMIANLQRHIEEINNLNVFPVPDGDTGSNMFSTVLSAWNYIQDTSASDLEIFKDFSDGALLGARGNSGVITSQIIRGFYEGFKLVDRVETKEERIKIVLGEVKKYSYNAVSNPVEGTILSVVSKINDYYNYDQPFIKILDTVDEIYQIAKKATDDTPEQLAILKESGVVDSGAYGLTMLIQGVKKALEGKTLKIITSSLKKNGKSKTFFKADPYVNIGYCTEAIITLRNNIKFRKHDLEKKLKKLGDSIVLIKDGDMIKLHIHAKNPGDIFNEMQKYGEFTMTKADNMASQVFVEGHEIIKNKFKIKSKYKNLQELSSLPANKKIKRTKLIHEQLGIVAVSNGLGLDNEFKELGVDVIISGGQTMNPSVNDFIEKIKNMNYKNILLLPNNSNIILTVEVVKKNIKNKKIFILKTKSLAQGLVALYNINKEMVNFADFQDEINKSINSVIDGEITKSTRDTEFNGLKILKNDYIAITNSNIITNGVESFTVAKKLIDYIMEKPQIEILNILYNEEVKQEEVSELEKYALLKNKNLEILSRYGGQKLYSYIIFGE